ncbi:interleukin-2 receptor subunit beta [Pipistrellus kuhlii]|uniref:Interleukin-2 receptor subunit beta n=1 Tax=Pipistrellus kuhlii TaxID=59472 RepID=A0A7J7ZIZ5_PIPKU|nr:interleukin-2 receptor subunit beta [Pipistrellus kuhlii]KAF6373916.1 interleukin 2 receptor subunit beta [Pipistrellus kuhlii]
MAAPALTWRLSLLAFLLALAIPLASTAANDTSALTCFYNSRANISCVWSRDGGPQASSCHVHARPDNRPWNESCELLPTGPASWSCNLILGPRNAQKLTAADTVNISVRCLEGERWTSVLTQNFKPFDNLRLMAPDSLQVVQEGSSTCNITWDAPQASHYITSYLEFEVRTRSLDHSWEEASVLSLKQNQRWIFLETLAPDTPYELQVRVRAQRGSLQTWSPWSRPLAFRTRPEEQPLAGRRPDAPSLGNILVGICGALGFIFVVYLLVNCQYLGPWLKKALKCHIPDPSEFFSQLSSEHGGDFQKWLSSPFPSSSFSPSGPAPEISPLEVLDRDAKAAQLLLLRPDKGPSPSPETSGHSLTSCFTNQGYFFFHLPDALEIEACQVYFTYDPYAEELEEDGPGAPEGPLLPPLPLPPGEDDAYCTFPPREDLLLFSPSLLGGPSPPNTAPGGTGACEEREGTALQEGVPRDWAPQRLGPPTPGATGLARCQSPQEIATGEAGEEGPGPGPGPGEGAGFPCASPPGQCQVRAPTSCLPLNTDAYLSLQELQDQEPVYLM